MNLIDKKAAKRYLSAHAITADYKGILHLVVPIRMIDDVPTIDAVEVVRCKDCKYYGTDGCALDRFAFDVVEEGFCSYGERMK